VLIKIEKKEDDFSTDTDVLKRQKALTVFVAYATPCKPMQNN